MERIMISLRINKGLQKQVNNSFFSNISNAEWQQYELLGVPTKDTAAGILLIELAGDLYAASYEINMVRNHSTGRSVPIICDFCMTWRAGGRTGSITFRLKNKSLDSITYLCCLDLKCSLHVRNLTAAAQLSRAHLHETISEDDRIARLEKKLFFIVSNLALRPLTLTDEYQPYE